MHVRYVARSDVGLGRDGNEDAALAGPRLLAVADGMGGHAAGEIASRAVIRELAGTDLTRDQAPLDILAAAFSAANHRIRQLAADAPERSGMGTTMTALLTAGGGGLPPGKVALGHIGDSRAYVLRDHTLRRLTKDHTFVQTLVDDHEITAEEARVHPARSVVTKALQGQDVVEPDLSLIEVRAGDRVLMCSDGLTDVMADEDIESVLTSAAEPSVAADELIRMALAEGGPDNITVVIADIIDVEPATTDATPDPTYVVGAAES